MITNKEMSKQIKEGEDKKYKVGRREGGEGSEEGERIKFKKDDIQSKRTNMLIKSKRKSELPVKVRI